MDENESSDEKQEPKTFGQRIRGWATEGLLIVVGAVIIAALLRTFVAQMFIIPSGSMENTLQPKDRVLVSKFGGFERGDVVVFEDPGGWLNIPKEEPGPVRQAFEFIGVLPHSGTDHLIKRVIGMPGDHVRLNDNGNIEVNGYELQENPYLYTQDGVQVAPATVPFDIVVPANHIFVMGDRRNSSGDSRCRLADVHQGEPPGMSAFVPVDKVVGSSVAIVAPLDRMAAFYLPETFKHVPDPTEPAPEKPVLHHVESGC